MTRDDTWVYFTLLVLLVDAIVIAIAFWQLGGTIELVGGWV